MGNCWGYEAPSSKNNCKNNTPGGARVSPPVVGKVIEPNLKVYTYQDLRCGIENFKNDSILEEAGQFERVDKGWIDETALAPSETGVGVPVAIKKCNPRTPQELEEWKHVSSTKRDAWSFKEY